MKRSTDAENCKQKSENAEKQRPEERLIDQSEIIGEAETREAANIPVKTMQRITDQKNG
jgi:hypothetical protein